MNAKAILLSSTGLKNVITDENKFFFIFGEREIQMNSLFAEFISPIVSHIHHSDPTIDKIHYDYPQNSKIPRFEEIFTEHIISQIKLIARGNKIEINEEDSEKVRLISILLCNEELFSIINELYPINNSEHPDQIINELEIFEYAKKLTSEFSIDFTSIISSIASNFYMIDKNKLKTITKSLLYVIISDAHIKLESEDSLFDFINDIFEEKEISDEDISLDIVHFLEQIEICNLSEEKFIKFVNQIDPTKITGTLWRNLCKRFCKEDENNETSSGRYTKPQQKKQEPKGRVFAFNGEDQNRLKGIIHFLTQEAGGNVHDKGIVSVTPSSQYSNESIRLAKNVVDFDNLATRLLTENKENSWLKYDFKDRKVMPTQYSIRSKPYGPSDHHPTDWVIEGSNNDSDWCLLDSRSGEKSLCAKSVVRTFDIKKTEQGNEYYRYLRIRQTGRNANGSFYLGFSALEYFGTMI